MNIKKIAGWICWFLAFAVPAPFALLEPDTLKVQNIPGLIAFVSFVFLIFLGYYLVDSSAEAKESHGH